MHETLIALYFPVWIACAVGSLLFFWRRDPAFKKRWHARVTAFNIIVIGGFLVVLTIPSWPFTLVFAGGTLFIGWAAIFQTRVCLSCGKVSQPDNLVTAPRFCRKCGAELAA